VIGQISTNRLNTIDKNSQSYPVLPQRFGRFALSTFSTRFIELIIGGITGVILARILGPSGKGTLTLLLTIPSFAYAAGNMGLGVSMSYFSGEAEQDEVIVNGFFLVFVLGIISSAIAALVVFVVRDELFPGNEIYLLLIAVSLVFLLYFYEFTLMGFQALYQIYTLNIILFIRPIVYLILIILFLVFLNMGVIGALIATGVGLIFTIVPGLIILRKQIETSIYSIDFSLLRKILLYGTKVHSGAILQAFSARIDYWIIAYFLDPASIGYYALATSLGEMLLIIPASIQEVLMPRVMRYDDKHRDGLVRISNRLVLFVLALASIGLIVLGKPLITTLYGMEFLPSYQILVFLLPGVMAYASNRVLGVDIYAIGRPLLSSLASGTILVSLSVADFLLIPRMGINGAAFGYSLAYIFGMLVIISLYRSLKGGKTFDLLVAKKEDFQLIIELVRGVFSDYVRKSTENIQ